MHTNSRHRNPDRWKSANAPSPQRSKYRSSPPASPENPTRLLAKRSVLPAIADKAARRMRYRLDDVANIELQQVARFSPNTTFNDTYSDSFRAISRPGSVATSFDATMGGTTKPYTLVAYRPMLDLSIAKSTGQQQSEYIAPFDVRSKVAKAADAKAKPFAFPSLTDIPSLRGRSKRQLCAHSGTEIAILRRVAHFADQEKDEGKLCETIIRSRSSMY